MGAIAGRRPDNIVPSLPAEKPVSCTLEPVLSNVASARRFVRKVFDAWGCDEAVWTATHLVSELAANAVVHAGTEFTVEINRNGDLVRIGVRDSSTTAPVVRPEQLEETSGRGLHLVERMSLRWGTDAHAGGKTVWFEISTGRGADAKAADEDPGIDRTAERT
jgi:anti-sigma regulatory factor (Ser/Thr protein kinase)